MFFCQRAQEFGIMRWGSIVRECQEHARIGPFEELMKAECRKFPPDLTTLICLDKLQFLRDMKGTCFWRLSPK
jgi:hypothetical protein